MSTMSVEAEFKLREDLLANRSKGGLFLDHLFRLALKPRQTSLEITRVVQFDGLSLKTYEPPDDFRDVMTILKSGSVRRKGPGKLGEIFEQGFEIVGRTQGIPVGPLRKLGRIFLKSVGIIEHDGQELNGRHPLMLSGEPIGIVERQVRKYEALRRPPRSLDSAVPQSDLGQLSGQPVLVAKTSVNMNLAGLPTEKESGLVQFKIRDNHPIDALPSTHRRSVVITAWHMARVESSEADSAESRTYAGKRILNLGSIDSRIIATSEKGHEPDVR